MLKWIVLLSLCLHFISASFDYVYDEHSLMGKKVVLYVIQSILKFSRYFEFKVE